MTFFRNAYYFYLLKCRDEYKYYGHTNDLVRRISERSKGEVKSTKKRRSVELVYFEEVKSRKEAFKREMQFKNGKTRKGTIDRLIDEFSKEKRQGFNSTI